MNTLILLLVTKAIFVLMLLVLASNLLYQLSLVLYCIRVSKDPLAFMIAYKQLTQAYIAYTEGILLD